jgi:hypothetical protein
LQEGLSRQAQRFSAWRLTVEKNLGISIIPRFFVRADFYRY